MTTSRDTTNTTSTIDTTTITTTIDGAAALQQTYYYGSQNVAKWLRQYFPDSELPQNLLLLAKYQEAFRYTEDGQEIYVFGSLNAEYFPYITSEGSSEIPERLQFFADTQYPNVMMSYLSFAFGLSDNPCSKINTTVPDEFDYPTIIAQILPLEGEWSTLFTSLSNIIYTDMFLRENNFTITLTTPNSGLTMAPFNNVSRISQAQTDYMAYQFTQYMNNTFQMNGQFPNNSCITYNPMFDDMQIRESDNWPATLPAKYQLSNLDKLGIGVGSLALISLAGAALYKCYNHRASEESQRLLVNDVNPDVQDNIVRTSKRDKNRSCCSIL